MPLDADTILDRIKLKGQVRFWRFLAIFFVIAAVFATIAFGTGLTSHLNQKEKDFIARITVEGVISDDRYREQVIDDIIKNDHAKAVILHINSPGGTAVGGEALYESLVLLRDSKPLVSVMGGMATSAGYMISVPAERLFARRATVTGSIGVILEAPNLKGLADKLGINIKTIKTGALKGEPSMFNNMSKETETVMQGIVNDFYNVFIDIISKERDIPRSDVAGLADGRVFTGLQAIDNHLIDNIGGEKDALHWLYENKKIDASLEVRDISLKKKESPFAAFLSSAIGSKTLIPNVFSYNGLMSIWRNGF